MGCPRGIGDETDLPLNCKKSKNGSRTKIQEPQKGLLKNHRGVKKTNRKKVRGVGGAQTVREKMRGDPGQDSETPGKSLARIKKQIGQREKASRGLGGDKGKTTNRLERVNRTTAVGGRGRNWEGKGGVQPMSIDKFLWRRKGRGKASRS